MHTFSVEMCLFYHDLIIIENIIIIIIIVVFITFRDILLRELLLLFNYSMHVKIKNEDISHVILKTTSAVKGGNVYLAVYCCQNTYKTEN